MKQAMSKTILLQAVETYLNEHFFRPEKAVKVDNVELPYDNTDVFEFEFRFRSELTEEELNPPKLST